MTIEVWDEGHPRWGEFLECLEEAAPKQAPFVLGDYARRLPCSLLVALLDGRVAGFLRFGVQPIGAEEGQPPLGLTEAKIHAFAVRASERRRGLGRRCNARPSSWLARWAATNSPRTRPTTGRRTCG